MNNRGASRHASAPPDPAGLPGRRPSQLRTLPARTAAIPQAVQSSLIGCVETQNDGPGEDPGKVLELSQREQSSISTDSKYLLTRN